MDSLKTRLEILPIDDQIRLLATKNNADEELALNVACAESQLVPDARNPESTAGGVFQFIDSTWRDFCTGDKMNSIDNAECATRLLAEGGIGHWEASRHEGYGGGWSNKPYTKGMCENREIVLR